ncbi:MAG: ATP-binding cassette domain-containing protein [Acetobacteraceae bacterium]|nr:ATP-binding cassette domain-containing protein [Acetobacteraceae bacterium]
MSATPDPASQLVRARQAASAVLPLLAVLGLLLALVALSVPLFFMQVLNRVLPSGSLPTMAWLGLALAIVLLIQAGLDFLRARAMQAAGSRLAARLLAPALAAAAHRAGRGRADATQLLHDIEQLRRFAASPAAAAGLDIAWAPALVLVLALLHPLYGLVAAGCMALLAALNFAADPATRRALAAGEQAEAEAIPAMAMALRGAEAVVAMNMLPALAARWRHAQAEAHRRTGRALSRTRAILVAIRAARMLMTAAMVTTGVLLVIDDQATPGSMIAAGLVLMRLLLPFEQLGATWRSWCEALSAWRRMQDATAEIPPAAPPLALSCRAGVLAVERLVYLPAGAARPVLRGLSFRVAPGEVLAILGPSGAGKSTLLRLLLGMEPPSAGHVQLDGYATHLWERAALARHVGYLPQHIALADATIAETIARLGPPDMALVLEAARAAGLHRQAACLRHGYATKLREAGFMLSDGQRQRLGLARALYGSPNLLLLDEPNAHLDAEGEAMLAAAIAGVRKRGGAVLLVTHRRSLVDSADTLLVLRDGLIDRQGARGAVLREMEAAPVQLVHPARAVPA